MGKFRIELFHEWISLHNYRDVSTLDRHQRVVCRNLRLRGSIEWVSIARRAMYIRSLDRSHPSSVWRTTFSFRAWLAIHCSRRCLSIFFAHFLCDFKGVFYTFHYYMRMGDSWILNFKRKFWSIFELNCGTGRIFSCIWWQQHSRLVGKMAQVWLGDLPELSRPSRSSFQASTLPIVHQGRYNLPLSQCWGDIFSWQTS